MKICRRRTKNLILLITITVILLFSIFLASNQQPIAQNPLTFPTQPTSPTTEDLKMGTYLQELLQTFDPSIEYEMIIFFEKTINYTQGIALLKELGGFEIISNYTILNGICIKAPIGIVEIIAQQNYVRSITYNEQIKLPPNQITTNEINTKDTQVNTIIGADKLQNPPYGLNGTGVVVAVIDSGINPHTYLDGSRIIYNESFVPYEGYTDLRGHGTAVAGIIGASSGTAAVGVAPAVEFLNLKVLDSSGSGEVDWLLQAINEALNNTSHPRADIISLSLGNPSGSSYDDMCKAVNSAWVDDDTIVVAAAGNEGEYGYGTVNSPGLGAYIITVGSTGGTGYRSISYFSSRGPTEDDRAKPDLVAPGEDLTTLLNNGNSIRTGFSGTSASTPVVSGAIALLLDNSSNGMPWLSPNTIKAAIMVNAEDLGPSINPFAQGAGLINISATYRYLQDYYIIENVSDPPLIITPIRAIAYPMHLWDLTPETLKLTMIVGNVTRTPIVNAYFSVSGNASAFTTVTSEIFSDLNDTQEFISVKFKVPLALSVYDFSGDLTFFNESGALFTIPLSLNDASFTDWHVSILFWFLIMNNQMNSENSVQNVTYIGIGIVGLVIVTTVGIVWAIFRFTKPKIPVELEQLLAMTLNYCPYCGTRVGAFDFFCYGCGKQIRKRPFEL